MLLQHNVNWPPATPSSSYAESPIPNNQSMLNHDQ